MKQQRETEAHHKEQRNPKETGTAQLLNPSSILPIATDRRVPLTGLFVWDKKDKPGADQRLARG